MKNEKRISLGVVIVTYNRKELLKECIKACQTQSVKFSKIIIVNNHSTDGTKVYLDSLDDPQLKVIHSKENLGGAGGFHLALKIAQQYPLDYVLLIDDDAILNKNYNKYIVEYMNKDEKNICGYSGCVKTNN